MDASKSPARLPAPLLTALLVAGGFMVFTAWDQSHWWRLKADYTFGWLVPFFAAYVVWERWPRIVGEADTRRREFPGTALAWGALTGGALLFLFGAVTRAAAGPTYPGSLALALGTAGVTLGLVSLAGENAARNGWSVARWFLFPALVWLVSAPLVSVVENALSLFLLGKITSVVVFVFEALGLPLEQQGNVLVLPTGEVGVAEACSGIRSLMGCLFAGAFLGAVFFEQLWKKVTLLGVALGLAFLNNLFRSVFLTGWAYRYGPESMQGRVHDWTTYAVLGLTAAGLLLLTQVLNWKVRFSSARAR